MLNAAILVVVVAVILVPVVYLAVYLNHWSTR